MSIEDLGRYAGNKAIEIVTNPENQRKGAEIVDTNMDKIVDTILALEKNGFVQKMKQEWGTLTEKQQMKLYKNGSFTKFASMIDKPLVAKDYLFSKLGFKKDNLSYRTMRQGMVVLRTLVQLGILDRPASIPQAQIKEDTKRDFKSLHTQISLMKYMCWVIPYGKPALPVIKILEPTAHLMADKSEEIVNAVHKAKIRSVTEPTRAEIASTMKMAA